MLNQEQNLIKETALNFATEKILPYANKWDKEAYFPRELYSEIAELGFGGIYVSEDSGGVNLGRFESSLIIEALSYGCSSIAAYVSIINLVNSIIDKYGNKE